MLQNTLLKQGNKLRSYLSKKYCCKSQNLSYLEHLETIPFVLYNLPLLIPAVWTHDYCINPALSWKPLARSGQHGWTERPQGMANLKPQLSKRKGRTTDILSLDHKTSKETTFIQIYSYQIQQEFGKILCQKKCFRFICVLWTIFSLKHTVQW